MHAPVVPTPEPVLVVAAHPDDETIGAGALIGRLCDVRVVTLTDGAPIDPARGPRDPARLVHAARRRAEVLAALALAGVGEDRWSSFGLVDQRAADALAATALALCTVLRAHRVRTVITHAYEGGHPDHDAAAVAVHAACALLRRAGEGAPGVVEVPLYHAAGGGFVPQAFLGDHGLTVPLTPEERARKRRMLDAHDTQRQVLEAFSIDAERFRVAPDHDFLRPPHPGPLHYEGQGWGWTSERFRERVADAARALGLGAPPWR